MLQLFIKMRNLNRRIWILIKLQIKIFNYQHLLFAPGESIVIEQNGYYFDQTDITTNGYLVLKK